MITMTAFDAAWDNLLKGEYYHPSIQGFRETASKIPGNRMYPAPTKEPETATLLEGPTGEEGDYDYTPPLFQKPPSAQDTIQEVALPPWKDKRFNEPKTFNAGVMTERMPRPEAHSDEVNSFRNPDYPPGYDDAVRSAKHEIDIFNHYDKRSAGYDSLFQRTIPFPSLETFKLAGQPMSERDYKDAKYDYYYRNKDYLWAIEHDNPNYAKTLISDPNHDPALNPEFLKSWKFLKEEIIDMVEYPPGSRNFVTQEQAQIMQIQERNRQARQAMEENTAQRPRFIRYD
tara:strand:+ start:8533 stop:9390 length:858 start_codon:yes stop_codon:yes gene_type:complete